MATRFRLPSSGSAPVSPAFQSYTHSSSTRYPMPTDAVGDSSALGNTALAPDAADHIATGDTCFFQFVSDPLQTQNLTAVSVTSQIQGLEPDQWNNLFIQMWVGLYSNDGSTLIATLLSKTSDATELATSLTNRSFSSTTTAYNMAGGDSGARIVVEVSVQGTPTAKTGVQGHNATLRFGSNGASGDLPADDSTTGTTYNPWIEFGWNLNFLDPKVCTPPAATSIALTTYAPSVTLGTILEPAAASSIVLTAYAPTVTVTNNVLVEPAAASPITLTGYAPQLQMTVTPDAASPIVLTGYAPQLQSTITPDAASPIVLTTYIPTVTVTTGANIVVEPPAASDIVLTTYAPTVTTTANVTVIPDAAPTLTLTGYAPQLQQTVTPSAAPPIVLTTYTPQLQSTITPAAASDIVLTTYAPTVTTTSNITCTPDAAPSLVLTPYIPSVTTTSHIVCTPDAAPTIVLTSYAPSVLTRNTNLVRIRGLHHRGHTYG